jgi:hypothetical protein
MILVSDPQDSQHLLPHRQSQILRLVSRILGSSLDRKLSSGTAPESGVLLASRADSLSSERTRKEIALGWLNLLEKSHRSSTPRNPLAPACRRRVAEAQDAILRVVHALEVELPVPARGVAMACELLTDGLGPVYNPMSVSDLKSCLAEVEINLDPATPLLKSA